MLQSHQDVGSIELGCVLLKASNLTQVEEKLTTWAVLETEVQLAFSLERIIHFDNELVIYALENTALIKSMFELVAPDNLSLFEDFEGIHFISFFLLDQENFAVAALTDDFDGAETADRDGACLGCLADTQLLHLVD